MSVDLVTRVGGRRLRAELVASLSLRHRGRWQGISARDLAAELQVNERTLRQLITDARQEGTAIAGTPRSGYFIADTADEIDECCRFLRRRAMHSLVLEARLRNIALPDLLGQLHLNT